MREGGSFIYNYAIILPRNFMARKISATRKSYEALKLYYNGQISSFKKNDKGGDEKLIIDKIVAA